MGFSEAVTFQINRCLIEVPLQAEFILTRNGRLCIKSSRLRDRTGEEEVEVVATAVPTLYGCKTQAELKEQLGAQSLTSIKTRMNARGVLRLENGVAKRYVAEVESTPLEAVVSMTAMQIMVDDEVTDDGRQ